MSSKDWGKEVETQRKLYLTYVRSVLEYASPSWNSWISVTNRKKLQIIHNQSLRAITNMCKTCPTDFLHLEAGIEPLNDRLEQMDDILWDKYCRLPPHDPRRKLQEKVFPTWTGSKALKTRIGWRTKTAARMEDFKIKRETTTPPLPPWKDLRNVTFEETPLEKSKAEYSKEELQAITFPIIERIHEDICIYTDGSTDSNQTNGGAGVYIADLVGQRERDQRMCNHYRQLVITICPEE